MSRRRTVLLTLLFLALTQDYVPVLAQQGCEAPLPLTPSKEANIFTEEQEMDLGDIVADHIQSRLKVIDNDVLTGPLTRVGERLLKYFPDTKIRFRFLLVDLPMVNAISMPGGRIYVTRKLVASTRSEDELAGVLAHEIGHQVARHSAIDMTRLLRDVAGVAKVTDRNDIFEKYNQFLENVARSPKAAVRNRSYEAGEQTTADQLSLYALTRAGYDPEALAAWFDRFTESEGNTGSFISDLFGLTKPESRRLREMVKGASSLPKVCLAARAAAPSDEYREWQAAVVKQAGLSRKESLHSVISKTLLTPQLRGELTHLRFSPDGKYLLAQDEANIYVLVRDPLALLFTIDAPGANPAQFSPDSRSIAFHNPALRVEVWNIDTEARESLRELTLREGCARSALSPDGRILACQDAGYGLNLLDVASGAPVFYRKSWIHPVYLENMSFSPDGRYFIGSAWTTQYGVPGRLGIGMSQPAVEAVAVNLQTKAEIKLSGSTQALLADGFAFLAPDRLVARNFDNPKKSAVISWPEGKIVEELALPTGRMSGATRGGYLLLWPFDKFAVGVVDVAQRRIIKSGKTAALDIYADVFASERLNGEVALYGTSGNEVRAALTLPPKPLSLVRTSAVSEDLQWLAVSHSTRGSVWNLRSGQQRFYVRGFRGAYFGPDGALYADFPSSEGLDERQLVRLDTANGQATGVYGLPDTAASQVGPFLLVTQPAKKEGGADSKPSLEVRDALTNKPLWVRSYAAELPDYSVSRNMEAVVLGWPLTSKAAQIEIAADATLRQRLAALKEPEESYLLLVLDLRTGDSKGRLLVDTGKGSFRITDVSATADSVILTDNGNRVLVYSLSTGALKGRVFGSLGAVAKAQGLICVPNDPYELNIYDLRTLEKRDHFVFPSPVATSDFNGAGDRLFVLTADQTAYVLGLSATAGVVQ
jgi:WD40 repeat protein